jgi:uncharacterized membrane protein YccC
MNELTLVERSSEWRQAAFNKYMLPAQERLQWWLGDGKQTSRDIHAWCQGRATADAEIERLSARIEVLETALNEARDRCDDDQGPFIRLSNVRIALDAALLQKQQEEGDSD